MKRLTVTIPDELDERFEAYMRGRGASPEAVVEDALREYLEGEARRGAARRKHILGLGEEPVRAGAADASENLDDYLHGSP